MEFYRRRVYVRKMERNPVTERGATRKRLLKLALALRCSTRQAMGRRRSGSRFFVVSPILALQNDLAI